MIDGIRQILVDHRRTFLVSTALMLTGILLTLFGLHRIQLADTALSRQQAETGRLQQRVRILREADDILPQVLASAPERITDYDISPPSELILVAHPERPNEGARWRNLSYRLQGRIVHEEALLAVLENWISQSEFQHQVRDCRIERQIDGLTIDCGLSVLLPSR